MVVWGFPKGMGHFGHPQGTVAQQRGAGSAQQTQAPSVPCLALLAGPVRR